MLTVMNFMRRIAVWSVMAAATAMASPLWAQTAAPQPTLRKAPAAWIGMGFMVLMLAIVIAISLMPSKRSHQD
jgi:hypothetical protein